MNQELENWCFETVTDRHWESVLRQLFQSPKGSWQDLGTARNDPNVGPGTVAFAWIPDPSEPSGDYRIVLFYDFEWGSILSTSYHVARLERSEEAADV